MFGDSIYSCIFETSNRNETLTTMMDINQSVTDLKAQINILEIKKSDILTQAGEIHYEGLNDSYQIAYDEIYNHIRRLRDIEHRLISVLGDFHRYKANYLV